MSYFQKIDKMFGHGSFVINGFKLRLFAQNSVLLLIYKAKHFVLSWLIILDRKYKLTSLDYILD